MILLRYAEGHDSTRGAKQGFLARSQGASRHRGRQQQPVSSAPTSRAPTSAPKRCSRSYKTADGTLGVDGLFAPNESSAFAMMRVLQDNGWAGKVRFIGFDASDGLRRGLRDGAIDGALVQDPVRMGYLSVKTMVAHLRASRSRRRIDTGVHLVTRDIWSGPRSSSC